MARSFSIEGFVGFPPELRNAAAGIYISGSSIMPLRRIILYEKSYSQLSTRRPLRASQPECFELFWPSTARLNPRNRTQLPEMFARYSHGTAFTNSFSLASFIIREIVRLPGLVPGTGAFTNQPFQSERPSPLQKLWNIFRKIGRTSENTRKLFQQFFRLCRSRRKGSLTGRHPFLGSEIKSFN
jgi:hypothetical protein